MLMLRPFQKQLQHKFPRICWFSFIYTEGNFFREVFGTDFKGSCGTGINKGQAR